jgi:hypothetical protein
MPAINQNDLKQLISAGFLTPQQIKGSKTPRLAVLSDGKTKSGKSHWALMTTPEPVAYIMLDPGALEISEKAIKAGRQIIPKFIGHDKKENQETAKKLWQEYRSTVRAVLGAKSIRTIVVDTMSESWELARLSQFGKLDKVPGFMYTAINAEFSGLCDEIYYGRPDLNIIYLQRLKKAYKDNEWDGRTMESKGYGELEYNVDLSIRQYFIPRKGKEEPGFGFQVKESEATRKGAEFAGLQFEREECSFIDLALTIFKDDPVGGDPAYWLE